MSNNKSASVWNKETKEQLQKLVLARLMIVPRNLKLSIGSVEFARDDAVTHVKRGDDIGEKIMEIQLEFLRDLASGKIYSDEKDYFDNQA